MAEFCWMYFWVLVYGGFLWFGPLFFHETHFHETHFHETHDKTWKMSKLCEDCSKEAYLIATSYMYESLHFLGIWQVQYYTFTTRATMENQTKGESWWQNVTLGYEKWLCVVIIEKETFRYRLQVYWKNVEVYIADTNKYIKLIPMPFDGASKPARCGMCSRLEPMPALWQWTAHTVLEV